MTKKILQKPNNLIIIIVYERIQKYTKRERSICLKN